MNLEQTGLCVKKCGLVVSTETPNIGASPDGLVGDDALLKVKYAYVAWKRLVYTKTVPYLINDGEGGADPGQESRLSQSSNYFYFLLHKLKKLSWQLSI